MNFKQQLELAKQHEISPFDLMIANEVNCIFGDDLPNDDFEAICDLAHSVYLKVDTDISIETIVWTISNMIDNTPLSNITRSDVLDKMCGI